LQPGRVAVLRIPIAGYELDSILAMEARYRALCKPLGLRRGSKPSNDVERSEDRVDTTTIWTHDTP
jgi:hypothetical protein